MKKLMLFLFLAVAVIAAGAAMKCFSCNGTGWKGQLRCVTCNGTGRL